MKAIGVVAAASLAGFGTAQIAVSRSIDLGAKYLTQNGFVKPGPVGLQNPLTPSGFKGLPAREGDLPPAKSDKVNDSEINLLKAGLYAKKGDKVTMEGPIHCQYKGYDIFGDYLEGNIKTNVFFIKGNAKLVGEEGVIKGQFIEVNFKTKHYKATDSDADIRPDILKGKVKDDIYLKGKQIEGDPKQIVTQHGAFTTCNLDHPHFDLEAVDINIIPNERAVLKKVSVVVLGHKLFTLPRLDIPLQEQADRYFPDVGESNDEGYFIKSRWAVSLARKDEFDARIDYMTKLGGGLGADYKYKNKLSSGRMQIYGVSGGQQNYDMIVDHKQKWGNSSFSVGSNLQHKNYLNAPANTLLTTRIVFSIPTYQAVTGFSLYQNSNEQPGFSYSQKTFGFTDRRSIGKTFRNDFSLNWVTSDSSYGTTSSVKREQIDLRLNATEDFGKAIGLLEYQRSIPVGDNANFYNSSDKTPVFTLRSDSSKLFKAKKFGFPFQTEFSVGEFLDPAQKSQVTRTAFTFEFNKGGGYSRYGGYGGYQSSPYDNPIDSSSSSYSSYGTSDYNSGSAITSDPTSTVSQPVVNPPVTTGTTDNKTTDPKTTDPKTTDPTKVDPAILPKPVEAAPKKPKVNRLEIGYGGRFNQGLYGSDAAQYTTMANGNVRYRLAGETGLNLRYNYLQSRGYTPLQMDHFGRTNSMSIDLNIKPIKTLTVAAQSGYDFIQDTQFGQSHWQTVGIRTEWAPKEWFRFRTLSTYDTSQQSLGSVRCDLTYKPGATYVGVGARYDGIQHKWGNMSLFVDGLKMGRLKVSSMLVYNGYLKEFEARHFSFTYDLHCAEAVLQVIDNPVGFRSGTQFIFMIRLKAFSTGSPFGTGQRGQSLGLGGGGRDGY